MPATIIDGYIDDRPDAYAQAQTDLATLRQIADVQAVAQAKQLPRYGCIYNVESLCWL